MNKILFSILFLALSQLALAQETVTGNLSARNSVYFEILGTGSLYSFNFDRVIYAKKSFGIAARIGITYSPLISGVNEVAGIGCPIELTGFLGKKKSKLEFGIGTAYHYLFDDPDDLSFLILVPRIGYRLQKDEGGFFLKTGFTPWIPVIIDNDLERGDIEPNFVPVFGFAIGHTFKR